MPNTNNTIFCTAPPPAPEHQRTTPSPFAARHRRRLAMLVGVRTVGVEEELLVVDPAGRPVPLGPAALEVAARRGEGETVEQHDRAEQADDAVGDPRGSLVPELKAQQLEFGTRVCTGLDDVAADLRHWRGRGGAPGP